MKRKKSVLLGLSVALFTASIAASAHAQDADALVHPSADSWPMYHGDYSGQRHSALKQITPANVKDLTLKWVFQTKQNSGLKSSPILVDGILYFTVPDHVWAIDARSGHMIWQFNGAPNKAFHIGHRGVSIYKGWLYYMSPDDHVICLDAKNGKVRWDVVIADYTKGVWATMAPLIVGNHVMVGVSGDFDNLQGFVKSLDPDTGAVQWEWDATPPVGTSRSTTGGNVWMTGTYDPELKLVYWGTGNPSPVLNGKPRPGDDLYTCSIVALNPDTGKLAWAFQPSPHDTHDWDAVETPVLADVEFKGEKKKLLMQTSRNGYFFVLDRTNGKSLLTTTFGPVNWSLGVDKDGKPIPNPAKEPAPDGRLIAPDEGGMTNYRSPSFDPKLGLFLVSASPSYSLYFSKPEDGAYGWSGADYSLWTDGFLDAIDYRTGKIRWSHPLSGRGGAGIMTTDSGLTFTGDAMGNFMALDTSDGKTLWHAGSGGKIDNPPITYELDGKQVVVVGSDGLLFAFALQDGPAHSDKTAAK
jgi:alcohol dehydrogenase (cytochrome c)